MWYQLILRLIINLAHASTMHFHGIQIGPEMEELSTTPPPHWRAGDAGVSLLCGISSPICCLPHRPAFRIDFDRNSSLSLCAITQDESGLQMTFLNPVLRRIVMPRQTSDESKSTCWMKPRLCMSMTFLTDSLGISGRWSSCGWNSSAIAYMLSTTK